MENVIWKRMIYHCKDLGDYYLVSNTGEIKGVKTGKIRKKNINHEGYYFVGISLGSRKNQPCIKVHRAVAETFLINENNYPVINHKDGNKLNNYVENLEFCTYQYNSQHASDNELITYAKKVICLNNGLVFKSITDANKWCNLSVDTRSISRHISKNTQYKHAGKHPETGEPLKWMYYEDYIKENNESTLSFFESA
jgi:hypothetical protein